MIIDTVCFSFSLKEVEKCRVVGVDAVANEEDRFEIVVVIVESKRTKSKVTDKSRGVDDFNLIIRYFDLAMMKFPVLFFRFMQ